MSTIIAKAIKTALSGGKPLLTENSAEDRREVGEKMQAKQIADMMAKAKKNAAGRGLRSPPTAKA